MKIVAVGDVALSGKVEALYCRQGADIIDKSLRTKLTNSDFLIANIECPLTDSNEPAWKHFATIKASPKSANLLGDLGVNVGSLANNHINDYGVRGIKDTISALEDLQIKWLGVGCDLAESRRPLIFNTGNTTLGIVAAAQPEISAAGKNKWGASVLSEDWLADSVLSLKDQVDVVIVILHFGVEFAEYPTPSQINLCRTLVKKGAKLVIGHHPHVPQAYEHYKDGFIAYSLGNFAFDMNAGPHRFSRLGLVVEAEFEEHRLKSVNVIPVDTQLGLPALLDQTTLTEAERYLEHLNRVIGDERLLQEKYYFTCRDNLITHLQAALTYCLLKLNFKRMLTLIGTQLWPQIFALRVDFAKFLFSGKAAVFEGRKARKTRRISTRRWLLFCKICGTPGKLLRFILL